MPEIRICDVCRKPVSSEMVCRIGRKAVCSICADNNPDMLRTRLTITKIASGIVIPILLLSWAYAAIGESSGETAAKKELAKVQQNASELSKEMLELREHLAAKEGEAERLQQQVSGLSATARSLNARLISAEEALRARENEIGRLQQQAQVRNSATLASDKASSPSPTASSMPAPSGVVVAPSQSSSAATPASSSPYIRPTTAAPAPPVAENGSYYGETSAATGRPKTVYVNGYYRKDGTYVRGHYRSAPSR
jgi:hypothetical protein